jgi:hypothetical protein
MIKTIRLITAITTFVSLSSLKGAEPPPFAKFGSTIMAFSDGLIHNLYADGKNESLKAKNTLEALAPVEKKQEYYDDLRKKAAKYFVQKEKS